MVVTTREKSGCSRTSRSQSVLFPEPAGPAITSRTGGSDTWAEFGAGADIRSESIGECHDRENNSVSCQHSTEPPRARRLLPDSLVTVSTCIAETFPSAEAPHPDLALDDSRFWPPDVFLDPAAAREFHRGALAGRRGIRLIGISLHPAELDRWLANEGFAATAVEDGVSKALERRRPAGDAGVVLGYVGRDDGRSRDRLQCGRRRT